MPAVQVFRFDPVVAAADGPPSTSGSGDGGRFGALIHAGEHVTASVLYLAAGETYTGPGGAEGGPGTVLAVVSGSGRVSEAVAGRVGGGVSGAAAGGVSGAVTGRVAGGVSGEVEWWDLPAGYGASWVRAERVEVSTAEGLTALVLQGRFQLVATLVSQPIFVQDYDARWPEWFEQVRDAVWPAVAGVAVRIDHVGSTSVPGLAAKPIIDLDVVVADTATVPEAVAAIETLGYRWRGDLGIAGREAFHPPAGWVGPEHHLYLVVDGNKAHLDHTLLRDLLRSEPEARERYGDLKRRNAAAAGGDMDFYVAAKAERVAELLTRARAERGLPPAEYWHPGPLSRLRS